LKGGQIQYAPCKRKRGKVSLESEREETRKGQTWKGNKSSQGGGMDERRISLCFESNHIRRCWGGQGDLPASLKRDCSKHFGGGCSRKGSSVKI